MSRSRGRRLRVSARLRAIVDAIGTDGGVLADIGTDHAFVPIEALRRGVVRRAIGVDRLREPLRIAARMLARASLTDRVELRQGDGLAPLAGEADTIVVAGLGAGTIRRILAAGGEPLRAARRLVLAPVGCPRRVREWLRRHSWRLVGEQEVADEARAVAYTILAAEPGDGEAPYRDRRYAPAVLLRAGPFAVERPNAFTVRRLERELRATHDVLRALRGRDGHVEKVARCEREAGEIEATLAVLRQRT